jgi:hypothetical protein
LVVAVATDVLFKRLVNPFRLTITLGMVSRSEVKIHVESFAETPEEVRHKLGTSIRRNVPRNAMF